VYVREYVSHEYDEVFDRIIDDLEPGIGNRDVIDVTSGINRLEAYANRRQNIVRRAGYLTVQRGMPPLKRYQLDN
jgi:hypothetical protein